MMLSHEAFSAEWLAEPTLSTKIQQYDNIGQTAIDEQRATAYIIDPAISLKVRDINWNYGLDTRIRATRYSGISNEDNNNVFANMNAGYNSETTSWSIVGDYSKNTTFDDDFDTEQLAAGIGSEQREIETTSIRPSVGWNINETVNMLLNLSAAQVDDTTYTSPRSYESKSADLSLTWKASAQEKVIGKVSGLDSDNPDLNLNTRNTTYLLTYAYSFTELTSLSVSIGKHYVEGKITNNTSICDGAIVDLGDFGLVCTGEVIVLSQTASNRETGNSFDLNLSTGDELSNYSLSASRELIPSSFGSAQEQDRVTIKLNRKITPRFSWLLIADVNETTSVDSVSATLDRKRTRVEPGMAWKITKDWNISAGYRHIKQVMAETGLESASNSLFIRLSLGWPSLFSTY
ncbi:MAG: hypothetical protein OEY89_00600 [Gammaproteobacteria bacterium]|nr:hypothetical protein [Gammaproteobacteria bacterium]